MSAQAIALLCVVGTVQATDYAEQTYGPSSSARQHTQTSAHVQQARKRQAGNLREKLSPDSRAQRSTAHNTTSGQPQDSSDRANPVGTCATTPRNGETMSQVRADLGRPASTRGPVGKPPITRWNYAGCHVYFERAIVIHTVVPGDPEPLFHINQLTSRP